ncbi:MAG: short-chain Z-isoprenyl diphosphate synthase [Frankiales bacterium]|jgi:short-chain Z-isoprenyl diphosphate synthase|nr:short-chain Z-isoprenyl diphosphate synthase [Frankiales bacterium]
MGLRDLVYTVYEKRLRRSLAGVPGPRHVGVILDGNRRWARSVGARDVYRQGADRIDDLLDWCADAEVEVVTLWLLSTDNLSRPDDELDPLFRVIERTVEGLAAPDKLWRVHPVGSLDLLPEATQHILKTADESTVDKPGLLVNVAIGYGGRREITDAVRSMLLEAAGNGASLEELAETLDVEHIADHLYTKGQPDPDLVIRTSGEQRLSGFLLWQSAHSEFYFCEAFWPEFRHVDFLRALRAYGERHRRYGS